MRFLVVSHVSHYRHGDGVVIIGGDRHLSGTVVRAFHRINKVVVRTNGAGPAARRTIAFHYTSVELT